MAYFVPSKGEPFDPAMRPPRFSPPPVFGADTQRPLQGWAPNQSVGWLQQLQHLLGYSLPQGPQFLGPPVHPGGGPGFLGPPVHNGGGPQFLGPPQTQGFGRGWRP